MSVPTVAARTASTGAGKAAAGKGAAGKGGSARAGKPPRASRTRSTGQQTVPPPQRRARAEPSTLGDGQEGTRRHGARQDQQQQERPRPARTRPDDGPIGPQNTYQRWIVAEFLACVAIIATAPFLTPRSSTEDVSAPSLAGPLQPLSAVCIVFFVLALAAGGPRSGRIAAAFGGLVTLAALLHATDAIKGVSLIFAKNPTPTGGGGGGGRDTAE